MTKLSFWQRLMKSIAPAASFARMEAESRAWMAQCQNCKFERSIWEIGGIRSGASGSPRVYRRCSNCGKTGWHIVYKTIPPHGV
jgi:hypothetical protein